MKFEIDSFRGERTESGLVFDGNPIGHYVVSTNVDVGTDGFEDEFVGAIMEVEYPCNFAIMERRFSTDGNSVELIMDASCERHLRMTGRDEDDKRPSKIFKVVGRSKIDRD